MLEIKKMQMLNQKKLYAYMVRTTLKTKIIIYIYVVSTHEI